MRPGGATHIECTFQGYSGWGGVRGRWRARSAVRVCQGLCILNVNHSQTRKSRLTAQAESLSAFIDAQCGKAMLDIWHAKFKAMTAAAAAKRRKTAGDGGEAEGPHAPPDDDDRIAIFPGAVSVAFLGGTIERVRERCSGDCAVVSQTKVVRKLPALAP